MLATWQNQIHVSEPLNLVEGFAGRSRCGKVVESASVSEEESTVGSTSAANGTDVFHLTYLEGNSWLWEVGGVNILVDPILVGNLDFGIPWLYDAAKKVLKNFQLSDLPEVDCLLITQSLDDHCHLKTLKPLSESSPNLRVIATPNAKPLLDPLFSNEYRMVDRHPILPVHVFSLLPDIVMNKLCTELHLNQFEALSLDMQCYDSNRLSVMYLEPGQSSEVEARNGSKVRVKATAGPVLGPPWQRPENGYLINSPQGQLTLYYEPHCVYNKDFLEKEHADIVITPVIKQLLPKLTLVSGQEDAVQLAKLLQAKFIVPMKNGDLDSKGFLASIIQAEGTVQSFKKVGAPSVTGGDLIDIFVPQGASSLDFQGHSRHFYLVDSQYGFLVLSSYYEMEMQYAELLAKELPDTQALEPTPGVPLEISAP
ncbi:unnamed protein product [Dovyalis caffra]|uniref:Metallo-beta-lactamase domain-containing protein n=1 Tax=Dovyalis caffra TaxID=77055 RepID=A0AAV1QZI4_9ROSI|nr:unnamed protein product [Dovyalis caffra]